MSFMPSELDWQDLAEPTLAGPVASPRRRMRLLLVGYALALLLVWGRAVQLEQADGVARRAVAYAPKQSVETLDAERGRIVTRDGVILAADQQVRAVAMHYRYLQSPLDDRWVRRQVRSRLSRSERRDVAKFAAAESRLRQEIADSHLRLADLCGVSQEKWQNQLTHIQHRVERLAADVNRRRLERFNERTLTVADESGLDLRSILQGLFAPPQAMPPAEVVVVEQTIYHRVFEGVSADLARQIQEAPAIFPGVQVLSYIRRSYPEKTLAANLLGYVGSAQATRNLSAESPEIVATQDSVGLLGLERDFETQLAGNSGRARIWTDRHGEQLQRVVEQRPTIGSDLHLTIDSRVQAFAEQLLDRFVWQRNLETPAHSPQSGAVLVVDLQSGELLAAASQPRFDPNWFATGSPRVEGVLGDPARPLFDRATKMAIAPGSVFKPLVAMMLIEHGVVHSESRFACRGYLAEPDRLRCQLFRQHGIGHGEITIAEALAQSCNVFFFHHVSAVDGTTAWNWARRLGFGARGGQEGRSLPSATELDSLTERQMFAIGQGKLTATPLEVLAMYAAIANGGYLMQPTLVRRETAKQLDGQTRVRPPGTRIAGLEDTTLLAVREGLRRVVNEPTGTAYESVRLRDVVVAGKTGTAETGTTRGDHAWFAGYAPAEEPQVAFVVALEHGGSGSTAAGVIARHLVRRLVDLGYVVPEVLPETGVPPGKG